MCLFIFVNKVFLFLGRWVEDKIGLSSIRGHLCRRPDLPGDARRLRYGPGVPAILVGTSDSSSVPQDVGFRV